MGALQTYFGRAPEIMTNGEKLFRAAIAGDIEEATRIVGSDPAAVHYVDLRTGTTPLHVYTYDGNRAGVELICSIPDAPVEAQDRTGRWPSLIAWTFGRSDIEQVIEKRLQEQTRARSPALYAELWGENDGYKRPPEPTRFKPPGP